MCFTQGEPAVLAPPATEKKHALRQAHSAQKRTYSCRKARPSKKENNAIPNPNGARTCRKLRPSNRAQTLPNPRARGESIEPDTAFSKRGKALPPRAHARKRVLPIRPSASCLWGISCVPEARPLQDVNRVSMIHLATLLPRGFQRGPQAPFGRAAAASESAAVFRFLFGGKKEHATHPALPGRDLPGKPAAKTKSPKPPAAGR